MAVQTKTKRVYYFGGAQTEGHADMRNTIGGKGANLAEMTNLGIPVPPGFTISTDQCTEFYSNGEQLSQELRSDIIENVKKVETEMGKTLGDPAKPLLFSVRSGARISMPGMMDTVLNLGLTRSTVEKMAQDPNLTRFIWDSYRRFIQMFCNVVLGVEHKHFEHLLEGVKKSKNIDLDTDLTADDLKEVATKYEQFIQSQNIAFPQDPMEQLYMSIEAVFKSWNGVRAIKYRNINKIPHDWGTAVNVQTMVFGNMGETSGTGVAFTRNPSTGEKKFYGEYLMNAQGEDVVAGIRTPVPIEELKVAMPEIYAELETIYKKLELHFKDMQDLEFTIQEGILYLLQTRTGKRTATSALKCAVEMVDEGLIDKNEAVMRIGPDQLDQLLHPMIDPKAAVTVLAKGLPASPGAAVGKAVFTADDAEAWAAKGENIILIREETSPEDIGGMNAAKGILTARGGMTSHAAVVARGMGKCCVAGCGAIDIDEAAKSVTVSGQTIKEGDFVTLNGSTGEVLSGQVPLIKANVTGDFGIVMGWADSIRTMKVRTNADTPQDSKVARDFGAEGIGLCRTEHMFFEADRIKAVREMILSSTMENRKKALAKLLPFQKQDFLGIFEAMEGLPVTIRLLDPPLHEFLPHDSDQIKELATELNVSYDELKKKVDSLKEFNPMLGHRGCRLGITFPEIYEMQAQAIMEAACELSNQGKQVFPEIMVPLIGHVKELSMLKERIQAVADSVKASKNSTVDYTIGTMIEIPRAALTADEVAKEADFFSFGTNDLTQMALGVSRDDSGVFLPEYVEKGIYKDDPFQAIDQDGVGALIKIGVDKGRSVKPNLKVGICGEHGDYPFAFNMACAAASRAIGTR